MKNLTSPFLCTTILLNIAIPNFCFAGETELSTVTVSASSPEESENTVRHSDDILERRSHSSVLFGDADLRDVPFSVNVVTDSEISNRQAKTLGEALAGDPAVRNDYGGTGAYPTESFNIRGFEMGYGASFLKDGMPMNGQVTQGIENIEQIEVVRGPMGFRQGYIPPGGAINLISKKPTEEDLRSLTLSTDEYGSRLAHIDVGGRVGNEKRVGYRVNLVGEHTDLFFKPVEKERFLGSIALDYDILDDTKLTLNYDANDYNAGPDVFHYTIPDVNGNEIKGIKPDTYFGQTFLDNNEFLTQTGSFGIESKLTDKLTLSSTSAIYDWDAHYGITIPANAQPNGDFDVLVSENDYKSRNLSNTTYLNYKLDGKMIAHSLTAGINWVKIEGETRQNGVFGMLPSCTNNFFNPVQCTNTFGSPSGAFIQNRDQVQMGYYVADEMTINEKLRVLLAARHSRIDDQSAYAAGKTSATDPTLGVMYEIMPEVSVYSHYATGLENGGIAPATASNALVQLPARKSRQIEVGVKSDLLNGELVLDTALFQIEKDAEFTNNSNVYVQDGKQTHTGGEIRLIGKPITDLTLSTGIQYLHAELSGNPVTNGQKPQNVPAVNATFYADYHIPPVKGLYVNANVYYTSEREIAVPNKAAKGDAYTRLDLGTRYETQIAGRDIVTRLGVENVTDTEYYNSSWSNLYEFGTPRTFKLSTTVKL